MIETACKPTNLDRYFSDFGNMEDIRKLMDDICPTESCFHCPFGGWNIFLPEYLSSWTSPSCSSFTAWLELEIDDGN